MLPTLQSLNLKNKRVFVRADLNVPLDAEGQITDDSRIQASLPTLRHVLAEQGCLIIASHLGRPEGRPNPKFSLLPVAERLAELLDQEVKFPEDCVGDAARKLVEDIKPGEIILLENLRFHAEERANDPNFCKKLAHYAQVYINDAFGTLHRAHASTAGMVPLVPEKAAGLLVEKELQYLQQITEKPKRPLVAILGGAKVSDKLGVIANLIKKVDALLIGGAMAYTFLKAQGIEVGNSLVEDDKLHQAAKILERAKFRGIPLLLPLDHVVAKEIRSDVEFQTTKGSKIPKGWMGLDIGPRTLDYFADELAKAKTILWNGPLGVFETKPFDQGTLGVARLVAQSSAISIVGGGDSVAAVKQSGVASQITHLSTGGGATLEYLEGKVLPGLAALEE